MKESSCSEPAGSAAVAQYKILINDVCEEKTWDFASRLAQLLLWSTDASTTCDLHQFSQKQKLVT
jgi:hypothetical protein